MKKIFVYLILAPIFFYWGFNVSKYRIFPYKEIQVLKRFLSNDTISLKGQVNRVFDFFTPRTDIVFLGDSITAHGPWVDFFPCVKLQNFGVSGETTKDIESRLDAVLDLNPKVVFLMAGINDLSKKRSPQDVVQSLSSILSKLEDNGIKVYLQSTLHCSSASCGRSFYNQVLEINKGLEKLVKKSTAVIFIDINQRLSDKSGLRSEFTVDGVHLNSRGYLALRDLLSSYILSYKNCR